jgi:hypothetical protein
MPVLDIIRSEAEAIEVVKDLLKGLTADEVRALAIEALRRARRVNSADPEFSMHGDLGRALVPLLAEKRGKGATPNAIQVLKEPFLNQQGQAWMQPVVDVMASLVRAGLVIPLYHAPGYPVRYRLTGAGVRFLDADEDHPYLPGFVDRVVARCKDLPDEVAVHLADAQTCVEHGLGRPAVVLAGLAYEVAVDAVVDHLGSRTAAKKGAKAAEKIDAVKKAIPNLLGPSTNPADAERRGAAESAWDFADRLRARRNQGSHPGAHPDFTDLEEVHEWLLSAGRHLPGLWSVRI